MMKILVFTNLYPNTLEPDFGIFIRNRTIALRQKEKVDIKVVAPVPWFPPVNISARWYRFSQIPLRETIDGIEVFHPRYLVTPKIGMSLYGHSMFLGVGRLIRRIRENFAFDLIDAHFLYPDGFAACLLGRHLHCPVVLTARGSDVTSYLQMPRIKTLVARPLQQADRLIAVSNSLRDQMVVHGAIPEKISVIPNGIDPTLFFRKDPALVRRQLGLRDDEKIILTVCSLVELKGVDLLIEAVARLRANTSWPVRLLVVGKGPEEDRLGMLIKRLALEDCVRLVGSIANRELVDWYNAADLFFLGSSREGWPNVVCEALACGTPVVATAVNGIPEILDSEDMGIMVERTPEAFATGIEQAFARSWDRERIAERGQERTWQKVAGEVHDLFATVLNHAQN
jgi:glycosyltransferase involved in cell wall biosynthesis